MVFWEDVQASSAAGPLQPEGGGGIEPNVANGDLHFKDGIQCNIVELEAPRAPQSRVQARRLDSDAIDRVLEDIPVEAFCAPPAEPSRGLRSTQDESFYGASSRRKEPSFSSRQQNDPAIGVTERRFPEAQEASFVFDRIETPGDGNTFLSDDELPDKMPKLPFATRMLKDVHSVTELQLQWDEGDGSCSQLHDRMPQGNMIATHFKDFKVEQALEPMLGKAYFTRYRQQDESIHDPSKKHRHAGAEVLEGRPSALPTSSHVCYDDDEDSWDQFEESPRTLLCGGGCRLVSFDGLGAALPSGASATAAPLPSGDPADEAMIGLNSFVSTANDEVLSYILNQAHEDAPRRLAPGMLLPGQRLGFPLQL